MYGGGYGGSALGYGGGMCALFPRHAPPLLIMKNHVMGAGMVAVLVVECTAAV
jgi:hypothetical protein